MQHSSSDTRHVSPVAWVPTLYFAMGLPFVVLNMVCSLMYKGLGVSDRQIAFWTSLIMLPWTLKPLWSPFLELYRTKKFFVVLTQLISGVVFALVAFALFEGVTGAVAVFKEGKRASGKPGLYEVSKDGFLIFDGDIVPVEFFIHGDPAISRNIVCFLHTVFLSRFWNKYLYIKL